MSHVKQRMQIEVLEKVMRRASGQNREKITGRWRNWMRVGHVDGSIVQIVPYSIMCKAMV